MKKNIALLSLLVASLHAAWTTHEDTVWIPDYTVNADSWVNGYGHAMGDAYVSTGSSGAAYFDILAFVVDWNSNVQIRTDLHGTGYWGYGYYDAVDAASYSTAITTVETDTSAFAEASASAS